MTQFHRYRWLQAVAAGCLVAGLTFLAFLPVLSCQFVNWDDDGNLLHNPHYRGLGPAQLAWCFTTLHGGPYQPLSWISFAADYIVWGLNPFGYHLTSLLLHTANALLVFCLSLRLTQQSARAPTSPNALVVGATCGALFFSIHPLRVESVAWVTERRDVLSGFWALLTVHAYLTYVALPSGSSRRRYWWAACLTLFLASLLAKAVTVTLPVVLLLLDFYPLRRLPCRHPEGFMAGSQHHDRPIREKIPLLLLSLVFGIVAVIGQHRAAHMATLSAHSLDSRIGQALWGMAFYPCKTLLPMDLTPLYRLPRPFKPLDASVVAAAAALLVLTFLLVRLRRRYPAIVVAALSYAVMIAPFLGLIQSGVQIAADRYSYLPCLPWALLLASVTARLWDRCHQLVLGVLLSTMLLFLGRATWQQTEVWHDSITLWRHALRLDPDCPTAHHNLGFALSSAGRNAEAINHFRRSLDLEPGNALAHFNLGNALFHTRRFTEAIAHYEAVLELNDNDARAHFNLANTLVLLKDWPAAAAHYERATVIKPDYAEAFYQWGHVLIRQGRQDEAIACFQRALAIAPDFVGPRFALGLALSNRGDYASAKSELEVAWELGSEEPRIGIELAWLLASCPDDAVRDGAEAVRVAERLRDASPAPSPRLLDALAASYAAVGRFDDAVAVADQAAELASQLVQSALADEIRVRRRLYGAHQPYRATDRCP